MNHSAHVTRPNCSCHATWLGSCRTGDKTTRRMKREYGIILEDKGSIDIVFGRRRAFPPRSPDRKHDWRLARTQFDHQTETIAPFASSLRRVNDNLMLIPETLTRR